MSQNIWIAASDGDLEAVKKFIAGGSSVNAKDEYGYTPLHAAASYGHIDLMKHLIKSGANVNITDPDGDSPLFVCEDVETAKLLIENGADPKHVNGNGMTAAENAQEEEWLEVAHYLRELTGVPHPEPKEEEDDMASYLLADDQPDEDKEPEEGTYDDTMHEKFKERIDAIMKASQEDGKDRDEELKAVVAEMLAAGGQARATELVSALNKAAEEAEKP
ncbi:hypothetical protein BGZ73_005224 [Actinomortierella ambigua]|nr:hypothetical protein BGZ73_005224 [Actinomortierella ambigua]